MNPRQLYYKVVGDPSKRSGYVDPKTGARRTKPWMEEADAVYTGLDGSVWMYRVMDNVPLVFEDSVAKLDHGNSIQALLQDIGRSSINLPSFIQEPDGYYREFHISSIRWEGRPAPPRSTATAELSTYLDDEVLLFEAPSQTVFIGVKLTPGETEKRARDNTFLKYMWDVFAGLYQDNPTDYGRFEGDRRYLDPIFLRNNCRRPTDDEKRQLQAWFNRGSHAEPEIIPWPEHILVNREDRIEFSALERFNNPRLEAPGWEWVADVMDRDDGPACVSIRGFLRPPADTLRALKRAIKRQRVAEEERRKVDNEDDEMEEQTQQLTHMAKSMYEFPDSAPSIHRGSVVFGRRASQNSEESWDAFLRHRYSIDVVPLVHNQMNALESVQPCAQRRPTEFPLTLSTEMVSYSGIGSFSDVGDDDGAFIGLALPDRTPTYFNFLKSSELNLPPATFIAGVPGSGKALRLQALVVTPDGKTRMGDLRVGDKVVGRNGKPYSVKGIWEHENLEMFDVHLSDGQVIRACVDHQWVVSDKMGRVAPMRPGRKAAIERWGKTLQLAEQLDGLAGEFDDGAELSTPQLLELLGERVPDVPWNTYIAVYTALERQGCPSEERQVEVDWSGIREVTKEVPTKVWPTREALQACRDAWSTSGSPKRHAAVRAARVAACDELLAREDLPVEATPVGLARLLMDVGAPATGERAFRAMLSPVVKAAGVEFREGTTVVTQPASDGHTQVVARRMWPAAVALKALAADLREQAADCPASEVEERVLTTGDMLREGVRFGGTHSNFAIRVTQPLDLPDADLPVDPYVLGAWLGDGSKGTSQIASSSRVEKDGLTDQDHMLDTVLQHGYEARTVTARPHELISLTGLSVGLREAGVLHDKHVPVAYLRGSERQRLALLQGLMDTDGTVDGNGSCALTLTNEQLVRDALDLVRSLGIKASMSEGEAAIVEDDPDRPGERRRRVTGPKWTVCFTTTRQVFTLPRKVARLPEQVRATHDWLYITDIKPVPSEPGRCIQVDSPDHTYLVEGCVPTHNTFLSLFMAFQAALGGMRVAFVNPKGFDSLRYIIPYMESYGIECETTAISKLYQDGGTGMFDPFRYAESPEMRADIAANLITTVIELSQAQETSLRYGLLLGAKDGCGAALEAVEKYVTDEEVRELIMQMWESMPLFALCLGKERRPTLIGSDPDRRSDKPGKFMLTEFDVDLNLPNSVKTGGYSRSEKVALAAVRAVTTAQIGMLAGNHGGAFIMDEAHNVLGHHETVELIQRIMRQGRSLNVAQVYISQLVSDLLSVGSSGASLESYISRVVALRMQDAKEAEAALKLVGYQPTEQRIAEMRDFGAKKTADGMQPALGFFRDLYGRKSPMMFGPFPQGFADAASTNILDRRARDDDAA